MGALTDRERDFLRTARMDESVITGMDEGRLVSATGPAFMSWLRYAFVAGKEWERSRPRPKRRKMRLYGRARHTIKLRSKGA